MSIDNMDVCRKIIITGEKDEMEELYRVFLELNQYVSYSNKDEYRLEIIVKK